MGNKVNALHDERMRIIAQMREINDVDGALTAEQDAKWQELDALQDGLRQRIENEKKIEQIADSLSEIEEAVDRQPLKSNSSADYFASAEYAEAFDKYLRKNSISAALESGQTSKGGALVPTQLDNKIREMLYTMNPLREFCDVVQTSSDKDIPYVSNIGDASWIGEGRPYPESDPTMGKVNLRPEKVGRMIKVSDELLDDSAFDVGAYITKILAQSIAMAEEKAFLTGNGRNGDQPGGVITTNAASGAISQVTTSVSRSISGDDILKTVYDLQQSYRRRAIWVINDKLIGSIRRLKGSDGHYLWQPSLAAGQPDMLAGYRVVETVYLPDPAANTLSAVFGDWGYYTICDRMGSAEIRRYDELYAGAGMVGFRGSRRVDGGPIIGSAFRAIKIKQ